MFTVNCQVFDRIKTQLYNFKQNWEIFVQTFWRIFNAVKHKFHPDFSQLCNSKIDSNAAFFYISLFERFGFVFGSLSVLAVFLSKWSTLLYVVGML